jgi:hypothetical protein
MEGFVIAIVSILMPLVLVPTIITLKHRHKRREWEHLERMKAMELGLPMRTGQDAWGGSAVPTIGAGVPIASSIAAFLTCSEGPPTVDGVPLAAIAWGCAAMISAGAMTTSLILAFMLARSRKNADSALANGHLKPAFDPDSFDVVGSRA